MTRKKLYFDDVFADIGLVHTLNPRPRSRGRRLAECLAAAAKVAEGNAESWRRAWQEQGEKAERAARQADDRGHGVSAREAYLRRRHVLLPCVPGDPGRRSGLPRGRGALSLALPAVRGAEQALR